MTPTFPQKVTIALMLELELKDSEGAAYVFADPTTGSTELQLGMIADLFDVLSYHTDLMVQKINGITFAEVQKKLGASL